MDTVKHCVVYSQLALTSISPLSYVPSHFFSQNSLAAGALNENVLPSTNESHLKVEVG